ncbi:MAG: penicillin acylase family protein [Gemmatimonadaceae bacterium]|nr:penicillin acylase family protein [Gemmatimonadaceae bacterium]
MPRPSLPGTIAAGLLLAATSYVSFRPVGPAPALGPFLDPANGVWSATSSADLPADASATVPGLGAETRVVYDDRAVPHIFANSVRDAYRALGFVVARDRLFQLELSARAGGGTLTELVGARALETDRDTRASGMPASAEERLARFDTTGSAWKLATAYVDGVNAYLATLAQRDYPIEYKLLGRSPKRMDVVDILHLLNRMGATLATSSDELTHLEASARVGRAAADALFPAHSPIVEPIQPNGAHAPRFDATVIPAPSAPDPNAVSVLRASPARAFARLMAYAPLRVEDAIGSNNWAVGPARSASHHALLAGDPHLELTLPSIWYESHLVVRDTLDVYGVTIPGAPGIIIGFTPAVAWTFTNTGADVMDYYAETVDVAESPTRYQIDGDWRSLTLRVETYRDPSGRVIGTDTLRFTHRGPMRRVGGKWISVRWTVLESMRVLEGFDAASRASTSDAMLDAMASLYEAPAQNMLSADTAGTIGIRSTGRYPLRPTDGRGDVLRDGRLSANDWTGYWPVKDYPQSIRPAQGYLASANQEPIDPRVQPRYFGANWERPWRAMQINKRLRSDSAVTPDAMRQLQSDPGSARADLFVPAFLNAARASSGDAGTSRAATLLAEWDRRYTRDNRRAVLFEEMMRQLSLRLWDELRTDSTDNPSPTDMMTATLLRDSTSAWWDDKATSVVERRDVLLRAVMSTALDSVIARRGQPTDDRWRWDQVRFANIYHLLRLPAFSRRDIPVQGGSATIWPSTGDGRHGPSWRMVVELSSPRRAWATYPGGQSGNPLSSRYDDRLKSWRDGTLDTLRLPTALDQLPAAQQRARLVLSPSGGTH